MSNMSDDPPAGRSRSSENHPDVELRGSNLRSGSGDAEIGTLQRSSSLDESQSKRNLIINYLPHDIDDNTLKELFDQFGEILMTKVVRDKTTRKSLGYGFVKFSREDDANAAIERMNGYSLGQKYIKVSVARPPSMEIRNCKLYVTNLPVGYNEKEVIEVFQEFGEIIECRVLKDRTTRTNKGVAFVQFNLKSQAESALSLNDVQLAGSSRGLVVKYAEDQHKRKEVLRMNNFSGAPSARGPDNIVGHTTDQRMPMDLKHDGIPSNYFYPEQNLTHQMYSADQHASVQQMTHGQSLRSSSYLQQQQQQQAQQSPQHHHHHHHYQMNGPEDFSKRSMGKVGRSGPHGPYAVEIPPEDNNLNHHHHHHQHHQQQQQGSWFGGMLTPPSMPYIQGGLSFPSPPHSHVGISSHSSHSGQQHAHMQPPLNMPLLSPVPPVLNHGADMLSTGVGSSSRPMEGRISDLTNGEMASYSSTVNIVTLIVENLPLHTDASLLGDIFSRYGRVFNVQVVPDSSLPPNAITTGASSAFLIGRVQMLDLSQAEFAMQALNGSVLAEGTMPIQISIAMGATIR